MIKKALILGSQGQLGSDISAVFAQQDVEVLAPTHTELDITNLVAVKNYLSSNKPQVVVNTAAYHQVDKCEEFPDLAKLINTTAPAFLARMCRYLEIKLVHFSTDYVFDGAQSKPYVELDTPNPLNVYGKTKYQGELSVLGENHAALILRVSALYGHYPCRAKNGLNFVQLMRKLGAEQPSLNVVGDEFVSPTATFDIAQILPKLLKQELTGITHLTSEGSCSWHEFAQTIFELTNTQVEVNKVTSDFFPAKTPRPKYSVLENTCIKNRGMASLPHWKTALTNYLNHTN